MKQGTFNKLSSNVSKDDVKKLTFKDKELYLIYDLLLLTLLPFFLPYFIIKILSIGESRKSLRERFGYLEKEKVSALQGRPSIWLHAVSVGEINAAIPLVNRLKERYPELNMVVSTVTVTGYNNAAKKIPSADLICFFPLDFSWIVKKIVKLIRPKIFILIETEIWPNVLRSLRENGIPTILSNGRISSASYKRYTTFRFFIKRVLKGFSIFSMQSERDSSRIISLGADEEKVVTAGNIKFDQDILAADSKDLDNLQRCLHFSGKEKIFIAGSTHRGEEEIILKVFESLKETFPGIKLLLAPRRPDRFNEVEGLVKERGLSVTRKTLLDGGAEGSFDVVLVDTIGELRMIYGLGTVIFVGGSLVDKGGQNLLEPAMYKKPVFFGPYVDNFTSIAKALLEGGGGIKVRNGQELLNEAKRFLSNPSLLEEAGSSAWKVLKEGRGAIDNNMELINALIQ